MDSAQKSSFASIKSEIINSLDLFNPARSSKFDEITRIATKVLNVPISAIAVINTNKIVYVSKIGFDTNEISLSESFEKYFLKGSGDIYIQDVVMNEEMSSLNLAKNQPMIRFFYGVPIITEREVVASFFVADKNPRDFTLDEKSIFKGLADWVDGEVNHSVALFEKVKSDLTRKNIELQGEKVKRDSMLESIGEGVIEVNEVGMIIYVNKQVERLTGYTEKDLVGKMLIHALPMLDEKSQPVSPENRPIRNAMFNKSYIHDNKIFYVRKDKSVFPVSITATPIVIYDKVVGGVNVFRDITREYEVDKMKTEFISLASHQLRTPLSAMKWFSEMLLDGDVGELESEQKDLVENIYKSNERMIELVNTLLNISRIESGRIIIEPKPTDLLKLINEVELEVQPRLDEKKQKLIVSAHSRLPLVSIDPKLVRHVYMNLITNAIKYSPDESEIMVMVSKSGNEIINQISDNGYGIPADQYDKVFTKFFRAENVSKKETDGTGLGLYLTKAIVDSSGGKIWFESKEGKGTTFWFVLPLFGTPQKEGVVSLDS